MIPLEGGATASESVLASRPGPSGNTPSESAFSTEPPVRAGSDPTSGQLVVHVAGAVAHPGVYQVEAGARVHDVVELAGGLLPEAHQASINLAEPAQDGVQVYIPTQEEAHTAGVPASGAVVGVDAPQTQPAPTALINLNTASVEELQTLPKVGPVLAAAIVAWREENGGFQHVDELDQVSGIGPATLAQLRDKVTV
ncbi:helix-hairpin-helix domain-containing protein [Rothia nasimurium]|uniref:helix-hairpin-helix domain-containing protein n=1 Tax=Rothia nasimurium TaxID=85336 RepID=UPI003BA1FBBB